MTTRKEHIKWCKARALQYAERDNLSQAVDSMLSDLTKHKETTNLCPPFLAYDAMQLAQKNNRSRVINWINGFAE